MNTICISWTRYPNFFELWHNHRRDTKLLYVIGESHHCYIGSIGSRDGVQGLGTRYQWQYVNRAKSIFGLDEERGQTAFAGVFESPNEVTGALILASEAYIQNCCVTAIGENEILFEPEDLVENVKVENSGELPSFIADVRR